MDDRTMRMPELEVMADVFFDFRRREKVIEMFVRSRGFRPRRPDLSTKACTTAADCTFAGSHSPGKVTLPTGAVLEKFGSMNIGANISSACICTSVKGLLRNLRRFSSWNKDQSMGSSSNGSEKVLPFSLPFPKKCKAL